MKTCKLCSLLLQQKKPIEALELMDSLLKELKKLDDKQMLTESHLTEARIYHSLQNIPKCILQFLLIYQLNYSNVEKMIELYSIYK